MSTKLSIHQDGGWFHLKSVDGKHFTDHIGGSWTLQDGFFLSSGGCFKIQDNRQSKLANKDYFIEMREQLMYGAWKRAQYSKVA
jgi:hypothetical protein